MSNLICLTILTSLFFSLNANALCTPVTELEKVYCQLKQKGENRLPNFKNFKKNNATMQYLLLKRPAKKYAISLPAASTLKKDAIIAENESSTDKKNKEPSVYKRLSTTPAIIKKSSHQDLKNTSEFFVSSTNKGELPQDCRLDREYIKCNKTQYVRLKNTHNQALNHAIFSSKNTLNLPYRNATKFNNYTDTQYLSAIYPLYINKMITLGLADTTMSFTKFVNLYVVVKSQKANFSERFHTMYESLKKDKKEIAIKTLSKKSYPTRIDQCQPIKPTLIVCDNVKFNWLFAQVEY